MLFDGYIAMDKLKEIGKKLGVLKLLVSHNDDLSEQEAISVICEDIEDKLNTCAGLLGELNTDRVDAFYRHLWFVKCHPKLAQSNLADIFHSDYPIVRDMVLERIQKISFVHPALSKACVDLYTQGQYTSTIREAFVVWKEHSCHSFDLPNTIDGHALIDRLFSSSGLARSNRANDIETAFLEYCKASFTFFRNKLSHNMYQATPYEVDAALACINLMLAQIDSSGTK